MRWTPSAGCLRSRISAWTLLYLRFASVHLLARSLSDLLAGGHLASHCYLPQGHSVLRPVIDSCDLLDLFAKQPEQAKKWITTTVPGPTPRLPRSESSWAATDWTRCIATSANGLSSPFQGARMSGGLALNPQAPPDQTALFQVGPIWPEHPGTLLIWPFIFLLAAETANCGAHLVPLVDGDRATAELFWLRAFLDCITAGSEGAELALTKLAELPSDSPSYQEMLEPYDRCAPQRRTGSRNSGRRIKPTIGRGRTPSERVTAHAERRALLLSRRRNHRSRVDRSARGDSAAAGAGAGRTHPSARCKRHRLRPSPAGLRQKAAP